MALAKKRALRYGVKYPDTHAKVVDYRHISHIFASIIAVDMWMVFKMNSSKPDFCQYCQWFSGCVYNNNIDKARSPRGCVWAGNM